MIKHFICFFSLLAMVCHSASTLSFTSGTVTNYTNAVLVLAGPNNLPIQIERLNKTNQTWEVVALLNLNPNGTETNTSQLFHGDYGFFRAKSTNNQYFSTNAFGAVVGNLPQHDTILGNMFNASDVSAFFPDPIEGLSVFQWINAGYETVTYGYDDFDVLGWNAPMNISQLEGFIVRNPSVNSVKYVISGLFDTNNIVKSISQNFSLLTSPLYYLSDVSTLQVDTLDTNNYGGLSLLPVRSTGFDPECGINRAITTSLVYRDYLLTNALWMTNGVQTTVPLHLVEGFWINKPSSAIWTTQRPIW